MPDIDSLPQIGAVGAGDRVIFRQTNGDGSTTTRRGTAGALAAFTPAQANVAAAGAGQSTATVLTGRACTITTIPAGSGVILTVAGGTSQDVFNRAGTGRAVLVYPPVGLAIEGNAANAPVLLQDGASARFTCTGSTIVMAYENSLTAAASSGLVAPRRHRAAMGFEAGVFASPAIGAVATFFSVWPIPSNAIAARIVTANIGSSWSITSAAIALSNGVGDYVNPPDSAPWVSVTYDRGGVDSPAIVYGGATRNFTHPSAGSADPLTGVTGVPSYSYSDFVPLLPPSSSAGAMKFLFARVCIPNGAYSRSGFVPGLGALTGVPANNQGYDASIRSTTGDLATAPGVFGAGGTSANVAGVICAIEWITAAPVVQVMTVGDSQIEGATTPGGILNFVTRATLAMNSADTPMAINACAFGGQPSGMWYPMALKKIASAPPSICFIPAVSGNETFSGSNAVYMMGLARSLDLARQVRAAGGVPVLFMLPRGASGFPIATFQMLLAAAQDLASSGYGFLWFDACAGIGSKTSGQYDGRFLSGMSDDDLHPNVAAHTILAANLAPLLRQLTRV